YARVLDEHAPVALDILADMYFNSVFDEQELQKEKNVVIEEIRMYEDTPDDLVHDLVAKASYEKHPLGYSILGTEEVLGG
ncbi:pitrilysin family protein, partial [Cohnella sp. REN36]